MTDDAQHPNGDPKEKTRVCPTCRMDISVLATRCRFCGSEVGRPKEAARQLSASDLGGETIYHRAPSGSVLDAMEAFRAEEESTISNPVLKTTAGRVDDLPNLEMGAQDILGLSLDERNMTSASPRPQPSGFDRIKTIVIALVVLVALIFGGVKGVQFIQSTTAETEEAPTTGQVNRAVGILAAGGPPIKALEAAVEANDLNPTAENAKIEEEAFLAVKAQITGLMNAEEWNLDKLRMASTLAQEAVQLYPNPASIALKSEVDAESSDYKLVYIGAEDGTAEFRLNSPREVVQVKRGDTLLDRFYVQSVVGDTVKLLDTKRNDRLITYDNAGALPR